LPQGHTSVAAQPHFFGQDAQWLGKFALSCYTPNDTSVGVIEFKKQQIAASVTVSTPHVSKTRQLSFDHNYPKM